MPPSNRREFLKLAAAASLAATNAPFSWARPPAGVRAWVYAQERRMEEIKPTGWRTMSEQSAAGILIDSTKRYQEILGFGAAFTDASCCLLAGLDDQKRGALLNDLLGPSGLRLSVGRTCIGASDYSRFAYTFDESADPDPELQKFSIEHDREYILPVLRDAKKVNSDLFLFSSPWTPPGWMKASDSMLGGSMRKKYLRPALEQASLDTKIWILDHNYNLWGRAMDELSDPALSKYVEGVAWHGYGGTPDAMTRVHEAFPAKSLYWPEGGPDYKRPDYATDWAKWSHTFAGILRNLAPCIVGWNLVLDEQGRPNIGPFSCGGLVTLESETLAITRSGHNWAFAHYSKVVQRGARVIGSEGTVSDVDHVAFENPDGSHVLVLTNQGGGQNVQCQTRTQALDLTLDPGSITTLQW